MRFSKQQIKALEFFRLEARDPALLLLTRGPPAKTRNWLLARGYISRRSLHHFDFKRYELTDKGHDALTEHEWHKLHRRRRTTGSTS